MHAALLTMLLLAQDTRNTNVPNTDTRFTMPAYRTLGDWEKRAKELRRQILISTGLDPMPAKHPLNARVFGKIDGRDYTIEKVLLETIPGYYLGGNLYRPKGRAGKSPGILMPHGHWNYGRLENSATFSGPSLGISLARQGHVAFAYDMVGYNDTIQTPHDFGSARNEQLWSFGPLALQLWNSIRSVDFLESLPEVDAGRIAVTGASGGGTQAFLLAAIEPRIAAAAPVNMISSIMQGGSPCENQPGLRIGTNNMETASLIAPRPLLMVSATGDWTRETPKTEYPAVRGIYELFDRAANVETVQFDAPHNYNKDSREAVYRFFAKRLLAEDPSLPKFKESGIRIERLQDMLALHARALPDGALDFAGVFEAWKKMTATAERDRERMRITLGSEWPAKVNAQIDGERIVLSRPDRGDRVEGLWIPGSGPATVIVHPEGAAAGRARVEGRRSTLVLTVFQTGTAVAPRDRSHRHFLTFNKSDDAERVQDILTALAWLVQEKHAGTSPKLIGVDRAAPWCIYAAAVAPMRIDLDAPRGDFEFFAPGIERIGGIKAALALASR